MHTSKYFRVLVVEDEGLIAADISRRLEMLGHSIVATASTAEEAIEHADQAEVVLMDIRLDGQKDGIDAALEIRARHHIPVVFLTAHADRATLERAKRVGPFGYVVKPLGPATLQAALEMAVSKHAMERQLEEQEAWLRATIASAADAVVVADAAGHVLLLNQAAQALTGWLQPDAKGRALDVVLPLHSESLASSAGDLATLALLRDQAVTFPEQARIASREGHLVTVEGAIAPVKTSAGSHGVVVTLRDVGSREWEELQLRRAQRMEAASKLAASVVNDYNNLIGIVRYRAGQLLTQFSQYSPARQHLEEISRAAVAADQITRRLASFGMRQPLELEILSLNGVLRRLSKAVESVVGRGIKVALQQHAGMGRVRADPIQLEQAIMNLVLHAAAVTEEGGWLRVETQAAHPRGNGGAWVSLAIDYSAEEPDLERLFDPSEDPDTGLALAVAHAIVTESEGYLSASRLPQGGTRVELLLPSVADALAPSLAVAGAMERPRTVLLVDPRERVRQHLHRVFVSAGYLLLDATTPDEALALAELHEGPIDLLIADEEDVQGIALAMEADHPGLQILRIVAAPEKSAHELRQPFTEQALMEKTLALLESGRAVPASGSA